MAHITGSASAAASPATMGKGLTLEQLNETVESLQPSESVVVLGLPDSLYHKSKGYSRSALTVLLDRTPRHFWDRYVNPEPPPPREDTEATIIGKVYHSLALEPEYPIEDMIYPYEKPNRRTKEGKARWAAMVAEAGDKLMIEQTKLDEVKEMAKKARATPLVQGLFSGGDAEVSIYWRDISGVLLKVRPDYVKWAEKILGDLKSTLNAHPLEFSNSIGKFHYHTQVAMYLEGIRVATNDETWNTFVFAAAEKERPYEAASYILDPEDAAIGRAQFQHAVSVVAHCTETGVWPGYPMEVTIIGMKPWHQKKHRSSTVSNG